MLAYLSCACCTLVRLPNNVSASSKIISSFCFPHYWKPRQDFFLFPQYIYCPLLISLSCIDLFYFVGKPPAGVFCYLMSAPVNNKWLPLYYFQLDFDDLWNYTIGFLGTEEQSTDYRPVKFLYPVHTLCFCLFEKYRQWIKAPVKRVKLICCSWWFIL